MKSAVPCSCQINEQQEHGTGAHRSKGSALTGRDLFIPFWKQFLDNLKVHLSEVEVANETSRFLRHAEEKVTQADIPVDYPTSVERTKAYRRVKR